MTREEPRRDGETSRAETGREIGMNHADRDHTVALSLRAEAR